MSMKIPESKDVYSREFCFRESREFCSEMFIVDFSCGPIVQFMKID